MKRAVFLDRDGVINHEVGYIKELSNLKLIDNSAKAIKKLNKSEFLTIVVTNQSGPARGYYPESWVIKLHERLKELLKKEGAYIDYIYYCPHLPEGIVKEYSFVCDCRKPRIGMLKKAAIEHNIDLFDSYMIGDKATDIETGKNAGCITILVKTGYGEQILKGEYQYIPNPNFIAKDLLEAVDWILNNERVRNS